jgi:membrane associated rhomboid family serine protease
MALGQVAVGGVAWWAHIGGFVFGALGFRFFTRPAPKPEYEFPSYYR